MKKFESLDSPKFNKLEVESMKRLKGGYTLNTVTGECKLNCVKLQ